MYTLGLICLVLVVGFALFSSKQQSVGIEALEIGGNFKITKLLRLTIDEVLAFDETNKKVGFARFDVVSFLPDGTMVGDRKCNFTCDLSEIKKVSINSSTEKPGFYHLSFSFKSEIPQGNKLKSVTVFGKIDSDTVKRLKKNFPELPFDQSA